ncbi:alpha/beta hydrolase [Paenibacillus thailandensis]|uniref:Alpha/beta hydrolase n=1 Tax=Paenibacillus thailandensis TaxID=393250 RepID=A0ABW5R224_9BACL
MLRHDWTIVCRDGAELYVREWQPSEGVVKGLVCLLHGMGEHGERYSHLAKALAEDGFAVIAPDQRGHGRTPGKRGHIPPYAAMDDAETVLREAMDRHPFVPAFLYGHSMGGNIALNCALRYKPPIRGLVLSSPWLRLAFRPPAVKVWLGRGIARLSPEFSQPTGLRKEDLYRPGYIRETEDPYVHTSITVSSFLDLEETGKWALRHAASLHCPLLLLHGTADRITSWAASAELSDTLGERCRFLSWQDGLHELHNDAEGKEVIYAVSNWMQGQL